jgi:hypothetical protein
MDRAQLVSWVLVGMCAWGSAPAAEALPPTLRVCMSESDAARRLACFDRESARLVKDSAPTARKSEPLAAAPAAAAAAPAATTPAPAANAPTPSAQDKFGYRGNIARAEIDKQSEEARSQAEVLTAKVTELSTLAHGEVLLTLDNGQVWQQKRSDRGMRIKVGDEVTIRRATLGSFLLTTKAKGSMRVSRVK